MENIIMKACGIDVHQASVTACILRQGLQRQIKTFGTTTTELTSLKDWLEENDISHVAMESTGIYWRPVFNILGEGFQIILVNPRHIKNVPGRKTDVKDCEWICQLLRAGLLQASFIPPGQIRELRNMTRYQKKLQNQMTQQKNRVHKLLQEANIKITSVFADIFGVTGMNILQAMAKGITDPDTLCEYLLVDKRMARKIPQAKEALRGCFSIHHQLLLQSLLRYLNFLKIEIVDVENNAENIIQSFDTEYQLLQTIPGIKQKAAKSIIAEIGADMNIFQSPQHLSSWAGLCPGNNESAGKKKARESLRVIFI